MRAENIYVQTAWLIVATVLGAQQRQNQTDSNNNIAAVPLTD